MYSAPARSEERSGAEGGSTRLPTDLTVLSTASWSIAQTFQDSTGLVPSSSNPRCDFQFPASRPSTFPHVGRPADP